MPNLFEEYKNAFKKPDNFLTKLILVNLSVFVVILLGLAFFKTQVDHFITNYFFLSADPIEFISRPWTLITYGFTHVGLSHIFFNMLGLYFFGLVVSDYIGSRRMLAIYILGVIAGGLLFLLIFNVLPEYQDKPTVLLGASGGVLAIAMAAATLAPDMVFRLFMIWPIKIKYIVAFFVISSIAGLSQDNAGGNWAHIGGLAIGWFYVKQYQKGNDLGKFLFQFIDWVKNIFKPSPKIKVSHRSTDKSSFTQEKTRSTSNNNSTVSQKEIDAILDKISQSGYESLSKEEKQKLFSASQKNQ